MSRNLFIVEDDEHLASALAVQVEMLGYSVVGLAETAVDAVAGILAIQPDIVLMDVNLGEGGSGLEAAETLRLRSNVPIVFYTSYGDAAFRKKAATLNNTLVLEKPVSEAILDQALSAASSSAMARSRRLGLPVSLWVPRMPLRISASSNRAQRLRREAAGIREAAATLSMNADRDLFRAHAAVLEAEAASLEAQAQQRRSEKQLGVIDLRLTPSENGSN